jgi:predicted DsbA family dithiol-disulfide isomerase
MFQQCVGVVVVSLAVAGLGQASEPAKGERALAAAGPVQVTTRELDELVGNKLLRVRMEEYNVKRRVLEEHLANLLLQREATGRKLSLDELIRLEIDEKARPVASEEVRAVYDSARERFGNVSETAALADIAEGMRKQRVGQRRAELLRELRLRAGVRLLLEPPRVTMAESESPARGLRTAEVTVVEFSDFQCPFCARVTPTLKRLEEKYKDRVRIVFRDYPLPMHRDAPKAAEAARCAAEQGKFWEMHDALFANQKELGVADLKRHATRIGADAPAFDACLDSGKTADAWRADLKDGEAYGVSGTPTFFVNGRVLSGTPSFEAFAEVIDEELARAALSRGKASQP